MPFGAFALAVKYRDKNRDPPLNFLSFVNQFVSPPNLESYQQSGIKWKKVGI